MPGTDLQIFKRWGGRSVSLVLGSGGARGYAHIGVINWLEENGYEIRSIVGCSMGSVIGGIYALGKLQEYSDWVCGIDKMDVFRLLDFSLGEGGLVKGKKIMKALKQFMEDKNIEDLPIRFTAVASDIDNEKEVWINHGNIYEAIRASMALPLFFTPYRHNDVFLLDGGILNPVPIAPTFQDETDLTIAVNLTGPPVSEISDTDNEEDDGVAGRLMSGIHHFIRTFRTTSSIKGQLGMYDVINRSVDAMQGTIARQKIAAYPPDILVEIPRNLCGILEFDRAREIIDAGYRAAEEQIGNKNGQSKANR
ncbi:MAG: patatin-like phospholipase family protein [Gammaproteobacteria bacterium]